MTRPCDTASLQSVLSKTNVRILLSSMDNIIITVLVLDQERGKEGGGEGDGGEGEGGGRRGGVEPSRPESLSCL